MTRNPGPLQELEAHFVSTIGPFWKGTVGDPRTHFNGYHLGGLEVPYGDYSMTHDRDIAGVDLFGGYWASGFDVGMGWPASHDWLDWLVQQAQAGKTRDVAEIIGSVDGVQDWRWIAENQFREPEKWFGNHIDHTHVGLYRDSIFRSHVYVFDKWTATGRVVSNTNVGPEPSPVIPPTPAPYSPHEVPVLDPGRVDGGGFQLVPVLVAAGVAWVIKRRREVGRR